jgi:hypothetical protein
MLLEDPDAIKKLRGRLPTWLDELLALVLIGLGAVIFASLLSESSTAGLSTNLADLLRRGFGDGAYLVAVAILGAGFLILLPKLGVVFKVSLGWIIALEFAFIAIQGLLHALRFDPEGLALVREGEGGGYVGWAVNSLLQSALGTNGAIGVLVLILIVAVHWLLGISRQHYRGLLGRLAQNLRSMATRLDPEPALKPQFATANPAPAPSLPSSEPLAAPLPAPAPVVAKVNPAAPAPPEALPQAHTRRPASNRGRSASATASSRTEAPPRPTAPAMATVPNTPVVSPTAPPIPAPQVLATPILDTASPPDEALPQNEDEAARPTLVINGRNIEPSSLERQRPSIVPRQAAPLNAESKPQAPSMAHHKAANGAAKTFQGGRDNDPNKRFFRVADFDERKKIGKRHEIVPPLELLNSYHLNRPDEQEINRNASIIENTLLEFDLDADVIDVKVGPVVTQYAVSPIKQVLNPETGRWEINRIRVDRITNLQGDLALALSAKTLRIEAPVPGHSYVGIEVPNKKPSLVGLRPALESENFFKKQSEPLAIPLGRDVSGEVVVVKLAGLPHLLVAGTTGSGKSVFLTALVMSLVMNNTPDQVKLVMLDPKRVELTRFNGLPHLIGPVETDADRIIGVLRWVTREMDRRYKLMELENARNIEAYNANLGRRRKEEHLPYMVLVFDEIGDLMMSHPDETEGTVTRLAQKARAAGIHLVVATQRPSTEIITGLIKANFPARMSFAVATGVDSRVILDYTGAETLLGRGDMLYLAPDASGPQRIQGCYVSDEELEEVMAYWRNWHDEEINAGRLERQRTPPWERGMTRLEALSEQDVLLEQAIVLVCESKEASTSMIQRRLGVGFPRAAHLMDLLYELGIIGPPKQGGQPRSVLVTNAQQAIIRMREKSR